MQYSERVWKVEVVVEQEEYEVRASTIRKVNNQVSGDDIGCGSSKSICMCYLSMSI
jgi:hypothetical protein